MGLLFYEKLSQDLVKLVIKIGDSFSFFFFFSINKFKGGKFVLIFISV